jgi:hypothetical protein
MVINQFHSIGDILFIEPICRHFWNKNGEKPILPVRDHLIWMANYIESAEFVPMSKTVMDYDSLETSNPDYLPLRFANQIIRGLKPDDHSDYSNAMPDKYKLVGLELDNWKTLQFQFYPDRSALLFAHLNLSSNEDYVFVNEHSQAGKITINPKTNMRIVRMETIPGFTVLDWTGVMLCAKEHHHISTSTFYMLEAMKGLHDANIPIFIYPRPNDDGLKGISKLNPSFKYTP